MVFLLESLKPMFKKIFVLTLLVGGLSAFIFSAFQIFKLTKTSSNSSLFPSSNEEAKDNQKNETPSEPLKVSKDKMFNILLLGIDRRHKSETGFRTDIMILLSVNQAKKKVVLTSVPRDLWVNGGRINATYVGKGWEAMQKAFEDITGQKPDAFIQSDFEDFVWIVDSFGGISVDLDTAFTDDAYPNDVTKTYMTVSFPVGKQVVNGTQALQLARSRHGNNGEGSDFKRMIRQHKMLKAMQDAVLSPKSIFNPFNITKFYEAVTSHMVTDLSLSDAKVLWDFYPKKDEYTIESFYVDHNFLYNPPLSEYGGAWVLIPKNNDYTPIHTALKEKLGLIEPQNPAETPKTN